MTTLLAGRPSLLMPASLVGATRETDALLVAQGILDQYSFERGYKRGKNPVAVQVRDRFGNLKQRIYTTNTRTNFGRDWQSRLMGGGISGGVAGTTAYGLRGAYTGVTGTVGLTGATGLTASAWIGYMLVADGLFGAITANTTTAFTTDGFTNPGTLATGVAPATSGNYAVLGGPPGYWMSLANATLTITATDTVLGNATTNEYNTAGLTRALSTFAHTAAATTYTQTITFTCSSGPQTVSGSGLHLAGISRNAAADLLFENNFGATATLQTSDNLQVIWTITIG